jgi:hypothetical protein
MQNSKCKMQARSVCDGLGENRGDVHTDAAINTRFAF